MIVVLRRILFIAAVILMPHQGFAESHQEVVGSSFEEQLAPLWSSFITNLKLDDLQAANRDFLKIEDLRKRSGYTIMPKEARELIALAKGVFARNNLVKSKYIVRKALELSPHSPDLILDHAVFLILTGEFTRIELLKQVLSAGMKRMDLIAILFVKLLYPLLLAFTLGAVLCCILLFAANWKLLTRELKRTLPRLVPRFLATPLLMVLLLTPLAGGPLWTLTAYIAATYLLLPRVRHFAGACSVLLILWAVIVPLRENYNLWLSDSGVQTLLRIRGQAYGASDLAELKMLHQGRPEDAVVAFSYAKILRRHGDFDEAGRLLGILERQGFDPRAVKMERGILSLAAGDTSRAESLFNELKASGMESTAFYYNFSKVHFELLNTEESRELYALAGSSDPLLTEDLKDREELLGLRNPTTFAETFPRLDLVFASALKPNPAARTKADAVLSDLIAPAALEEIVYAGGFLLIVFLFIPPPRRLARDGQVRYIDQLVSLIPGGSMVLADAATRGFILLSAMIFLAFPLFEWPRDFNAFLALFSGLELYYLYAFCFLTASISYVGFSTYKDEAAKVCKPA